MKPLFSKRLINFKILVAKGAFRKAIKLLIVKIKMLLFEGIGDCL
jgi:hypothetical protein